MSHLLELQDFHYYYGNIHSVKGISLHIDEGEMVALIGANGAGKTTTLRSISGLLGASGVRGKILFEGKEIQNLKGHEICAKGIAHSLEGRHVFAKLSVEENLYTGACLRKDMAQVKKEMADIYDRFPRLLERRTQMAGTLSGGEQQMLAIGRALLSKPKLLLLDEPSLGLAPLITIEIFKAVKDINKEGTTVLFVEQNSKLALESSDRAYVMQVGEMVMEGKSQDLITNDEIKKVYLGIG